jgi:DNA-binding LacI/PurR family transcriptional regulator
LEVYLGSQTKIAHIADYSSVSIVGERYVGYKYALERQGIEINPEWITEGGFEIKDGYNTFMKLYHSNNLPEIIFTVNDCTASGVYHAAREVGAKILEDIGIAAF